MQLSLSSQPKQVVYSWISSVNGIFSTSSLQSPYSYPWTSVRRLKHQAIMLFLPPLNRLSGILRSLYATSNQVISEQTNAKQRTDKVLPWFSSLCLFSFASFLAFPYVHFVSHPILETGEGIVLPLISMGESLRAYDRGFKQKNK